MAEDRKSALVAALDARERKVHRFDVSGFFGLGDKEIPEIGFRVPTKHEEDGAVAGAHAYAKKRAGEDESARHDPDILTDAKIVEVLFRATLEPSDQPGAVLYPAFSGGPDWMRKKLTSDQLACLFNLLSEVKRAESPTATALDTESILSIAKACWSSRNTDIPEVALAHCSREWLTQAFVLLAMRLADSENWGSDSGGHTDVASSG